VRAGPRTRATADIINNNTESAYGHGDLHIGPGLIPELPRRVIKIIYEEIRIRSARARGVPRGVSLCPEVRANIPLAPYEGTRARAYPF